MKYYAVKHRGKDGKPVEDVYEAESDAALYSRMKELGIGIISKREVPAPAKASAITLKALGQWALGAALVGGAGYGLYWGWGAWRSGRGGSSESQETSKPKESKQIKVQQPAIVTNAPVKLADKPDLPPGFVQPVPVNPKRIRPHERPKKVLNIYTNKTGMIVETYMTLDGKTHRSVRRSRPPAFKYVTDQLLSMALSTIDNGGGPPMPQMDRSQLEEVFRKSLNDPIRINDDDPPNVVEQKEKVIAAREDMKAMLEAGHSFDSVLSETREQARENAVLRREAEGTLHELRKSGTPEEIADYLNKVNPILERSGAKPLEVPIGHDDDDED